MFHEWITDELRSMALAKQAPIQMVERVNGLLGAEASPVTLIAYFWRSFNVPLSELAVLGAWRRFGGGVPDEELDRVLNRAIEEHRAEWANKRVPAKS